MGGFRALYKLAFGEQISVGSGLHNRLVLKADFVNLDHGETLGEEGDKYSMSMTNYIPLYILMPAAVI